MKLHMYSIYDKVACIFNKPFTEVNNATAIRAFDESIKDSPHVEDYDLYVVAEYDDSNGEVDPVTIMRIRSGFDIKAGLATEFSDEFPHKVKEFGSSKHVKWDEDMQS